LPAFLLGLLAGCAVDRPYLDQALMADRGRATRNEGVAEMYLVGCPDVLDLAIAGRSELTGLRPVGPDGCIDLGAYGRPRVEGQSVAAIARLVAEQADVPSSWVQVRVAEYNSQQVYLIGQVVGLQRAVPYRGQETVLDLLQRVGGVTPGAAPGDVYVVRSRVADGQQPEVFHVDLQAIVRQRDQSTNVRLRPSDQIFVGETRQSCLERCFPPWLRPLYGAICGLRRPGDGGGLRPPPRHQGPQAERPEAVPPTPPRPAAS
jgi:protein involved in polysaccharide export with SLBB domain